MTIYILSLLVFIPKTLFGFFLIDRVWPERRWTSIFLKMFAGFALGLGISSSIMLFALWIGIKPQSYAQIEFGGSILLVSVILFFYLHAWRLRQSRIFHPGMGQIARKENLIFLLLAVAFLFSLGTFIHYSFQHPHGFSDAWTIWNNLARYIFRSNDPGLIFDTSKYFRLHFDYPVMYSLNIAWAWGVLGTDSTRVPMAFTMLTVFALPGVLWVSISDIKGNIQGALVAIVALMTPSMGLTVGQYSDALLALYILLAGVFLYYYQTNFDSRFLFLAGLMAGFSAWVKNEGLLFVAACGVVCFWLIIVKWKSGRHFLQFLGGIVIPLLVVYFFKVNVFSQSDLTRSPMEILTQIIDFSRYAQIGWNYLLQVWRFGDWPLSLALVLLVYAFFVRFSLESSRKSLFLIILVLLQQLGYFAIYVITPHDLQLHIDTSLTRLLLHTYSLFLFWLFVSLNSDQDST
jgi:hypothetical protein